MTKLKDQFPREIPPSTDQKRVQARPSPTNVENVYISSTICQTPSVRRAICNHSQWHTKARSKRSGCQLERWQHPLNTQVLGFGEFHNVERHTIIQIPVNTSLSLMSTRPRTATPVRPPNAKKGALATMANASFFIGQKY